MIFEVRTHGYAYSGHPPRARSDSQEEAKDAARARAHSRARRRRRGRRGARRQHRRPFQQRRDGRLRPLADLAVDGRQRHHRDGPRHVRRRAAVLPFRRDAHGRQRRRARRGHRHGLARLLHRRGERRAGAARAHARAQRLELAARPRRRAGRQAVPRLSERRDAGRGRQADAPADRHRRAAVLAGDLVPHVRHWRLTHHLRRGRGLDDDLLL